MTTPSKAANLISIFQSETYLTNGTVAFTSTTPVAVYNTTVSSSNTTGAITIAGGLGVAGNVYANAIYTNGLFYAANGNVISTGGGVTGSSNVDTTGYVSGGTIIANNGIIVNNTFISNSYTIPANSGAISVGPITQQSGVIVTLSGNSRWIII